MFSNLLTFSDLCFAISFRLYLIYYQCECNSSKAVYRLRYCELRIRTIKTWWLIVDDSYKWSGFTSQLKSMQYTLMNNVVAYKHIHIERGREGEGEKKGISSKSSLFWKRHVSYSCRYTLTKVIMDSPLLTTFLTIKGCSFIKNIVHFEVNTNNNDSTHMIILNHLLPTKCQNEWAV